MQIELSQHVATPRFADVSIADAFSRTRAFRNLRLLNIHFFPFFFDVTHCIVNQLPSPQVGADRKRFVSPH